MVSDHTKNFGAQHGQNIELGTPRLPYRPQGPQGEPKVHAASPRAWGNEELRELKTLARQNTPTGAISLKLRRLPAAIRSKSQREGISLGPANRSPYNRRRSA